MSATSSNPVMTPYRDRSGGLVVLGALTILLGAISALLVPLMFFGQAMAPAGTNPGGLRSLIPAALMYSGMAVILIWLGIGSIMARRWARSLLVIVFWSWLLVGVVMVVATAVLMPSILANIQAMQPAGQPPLPASALPVMMVAPLLVIGLMFIVVPGIGVLFYSSSHVRATCEAKDQTPRWTDACPLPLLAVVLWVAWMAPLMMVLPFTQQLVLPFFGLILTGWGAAIGFVIIGLVWAWSAWAMYQRDVRGWWVLVLGLGIVTISNIILYSRHNVIEVLEMMKYPQAQLDMMKQMPLMTGRWAAWGMVIMAAPMFGYLLYVKKFFRKSS